MYLLSSSYVEVLDEAYTRCLDGAGICETMGRYPDKHKLQQGSEDQSIRQIQKIRTIIILHSEVECRITIISFFHFRRETRSIVEYNQLMTSDSSYLIHKRHAITTQEQLPRAKKLPYRLELSIGS